VEHVRAHGATRERALANLLDRSPLPEVDRHGDDLGAVPLGQPRNGYRGDEAAGGPQGGVRPSPDAFNCRTSSSAAPARHTIKIVSSPPIVPAPSGSSARSIHSARP